MRAMRREMAATPPSVGLVVEHHPAAAIDLHVDEAGGEKRAFGQAWSGVVAGRSRLANSASVRTS